MKVATIATVLFSLVTAVFVLVEMFNGLACIRFLNKRYYRGNTLFRKPLKFN